jgi:5-formyltetrahydrofolate cyclo-ligase
MSADPPLPPEVDAHVRRKVKAQLRKRMRGVRGATPENAAAQRSARIVERLLATPWIQHAQALALFWPMEGKREVDLRPLDAALRARGAAVGYPAIDPETRVMTFRRTDDVAALEERGFGFLEPPPDAPELRPIDVIVVPALVLDVRGHRIGYGAGYYDRTLPAYAPPARTVGVGYDWELVAEVPDTEGDVTLDALVTDVRELVLRPA